MSALGKMFADLRATYDANREADFAREKAALEAGGEGCSAFGRPLTPSLAREWAEVYPSMPQRWHDHLRAHIASSNDWLACPPPPDRENA